MISLVDRGNRPAFLSVCDLDTAMGPEVATLHAVYGDYSHMASFWLAVSRGFPAAAISRENGQIKLVLTPRADPAEIREFLSAVGGYDQIWAEAGACARLYPGTPFRSGPVMRYLGGPGGTVHESIAPPQRLDDLYKLLCACFAEFDKSGRQRWCAYASHLFRHGLGSVAGIYAGRRLVCTGGIYAKNSRYAVIACVATHPAYRGQGLAGQVVRSLCDRALREGKTPALLCAGESLAAFYARLGFEPFGRWARIDT